jgi:hypothetical protein
MNGGQGGEIVSIDDIVQLHAGVSQLRAQHLAKGIARQPREEGRWDAEAAQTDGHIEA